MNITEIYKGRFTIITTYKDFLKPKPMMGSLGFALHITDNLTNEEITLEISNADNFTEEAINNILKDAIDNMISNHRNNKINSIIN